MKRICDMPLKWRLWPRIYIPSTGKNNAKVDALKVTYKRQYEKKMAVLEERVKELEGQVEELKADLEKEGREKQEVIEMSEELMRLTGTGGEG